MHTHRFIIKEVITMNRTKVKNNHVESGSDESNNSSHNNQLDLSLLRKPIRTSVEGFEEVFRAYRDGTDEVRHAQNISKHNFNFFYFH